MGCGVQLQFLREEECIVEAHLGVRGEGARSVAHRESLGEVDGGGGRASGRRTMNRRRTRVRIHMGVGVGVGIRGSRVRCRGCGRRYRVGGCGRHRVRRREGERQWRRVRIRCRTIGTGMVSGMTRRRYGWSSSSCRRICTGRTVGRGTGSSGGARCRCRYG